MLLKIVLSFISYHFWLSLSLVGLFLSQISQCLVKALLYSEEGETTYDPYANFTLNTIWLLFILLPCYILMRQAGLQYVKLQMQLDGTSRLFEDSNEGCIIMDSN